MGMMGERGAALTFVVAMALAGTAGAQEVSQDIVHATVGKWLIASEDGSPGCRVTFKKDNTIGGYALTEGTPCAAAWHERVFSWDFSDPGIVLRDAAREKIIGFEEQEGGPWKTPLDASPVVYYPGPQNDGPRPGRQ